MTGLEKMKRWAALEAKWIRCRRCRLCGTRTNVVLGRGVLDARLVLLGEAPGVHEDRQGIPFVGAAGKKLNDVSRAANVPLSKCFIGNILSCRPLNNRIPMADEVEACLPRLQETIRIIQPKVIVALGGTAILRLTGEKGVGRIRGRWLDSPLFPGIPIMPTLHPAGLLGGRLRDKDDPLKLARDLRDAWERANAAL